MAEGLDFTPEETDRAIDQMWHFAGVHLELDSLYEIRPVPPRPGIGSIWAKPDEFRGHVQTLVGWNRAGINPYFSINPRRAPGCRDGSGSLPGSLVVADFDEAIELAEAKARIAAAGLPVATSIVSTSPGHLHAYWRLEARLPDLATHKRIQQGLSDALGTCPNVCSHQQVMRLPGPFCNVKPERPSRPRVLLVECDPGCIYPASLFPMADPMPEIVAVPLEELAIKIEKGSLSDASRALIENSILFDHSGRRMSIFKAARDMNARGWTLADATDVLVAVGAKLGLERENVADIPRQVRNAFSRPSNPGYAAAETVYLDVEASAPRPAGDEEGQYDADLEALPLPLPPPMPPRPSLALSHGIIGTFMDRVEEETEAHPVALGLSFITAFGNCIGRGPHAMVGCTRHGVNLFTVVVGNTGTGRKGTGGDIVTAVVRYADSYWADRCQSPNLASGEGVIDALRDRVTKLVPKKGVGAGGIEEVVIDPGVDDKRLLITCSELVAALHAARRENSTLSQTLREAWDGKTLRTMAKNTPRTARDPHLSIIAHVTRQELIKSLRDADIFGGLFNRFLFVLSERARLLPHGGDLDDLREILDPIKARIEFARAVGRMVRSDAADRLWEQEYGRLTTATGSDIISAVLSRAEAQTLRLSMLMALAAGRATIEKEDLEAALDLGRYSEASARAVFAGDNDALFDRLLVLIHETPGITRSALHKKVGWKVPAPTLLGTLSRLQAFGLARREAVKTGGRPTEKWFPENPKGKEEKQEKGRRRRRRPPAEAFPAFPPFHPDSDSAPAASSNAPAETNPEMTSAPTSPYARDLSLEAQAARAAASSPRPQLEPQAILRRAREKASKLLARQLLEGQPECPTPGLPPAIGAAREPSTDDDIPF